jgi:hypothetical protein
MYFVVKRQLDLGRAFAFLQPSLDLFLRRDADDQVSFDRGLARQGIPGFHVGGREVLRGTPLYRAFFDDNSAAPTAPLAAAG